MRPAEVVRLDAATFNAAVSALGIQLEALLLAIEATQPELKWYVADVQATGPCALPRGERSPTLVGPTRALIEATRRVDQFESAVFAGVPTSIERPTFRPGGLWTDDAENADLGDAIIEVRAFDTSYWSVAAVDAATCRAILQRLPARLRPTKS